MEDQEIVHTALEHLEPALLKGEWNEYAGVNEGTDEHAGWNNPINGELTLLYEHQTLRFEAIVYKELRTYQVDKIINQAHRYHNPIVIAYRLYPALKEKLKKHRINYLEANGNLFVQTQNVMLFLDRDKKLTKPRKTGNRAFTPTGLKVVFGFLQHKDLINKPQRTIANVTDVALGNIPKVIQGLQETGFLHKVNKNTYAITNREELLHRWIEEYKDILQPTLAKGTYTIKPVDKEWRKLNLHTTDTVWGGEPAGDMLTNYLRPERLIIYTNETKKSLMMHYGLMPDPNGDVQVYDKFWKDDDEQATAPDILVYADLMNTDDNRCIETARMIYNERIKPEL